MTSIGPKIIRNCGTPKSNSTGKTIRPIKRPPDRATRRSHMIHESSPRLRTGSARPASTIRIAIPIRVMAAPPMSIRWVGPQSVTSWPKILCQTSSRGKPIRANIPQVVITTPPRGAYQSPTMRTALREGFSRGRTQATKPAVKIPKRPPRMR